MSIAASNSLLNSLIKHKVSPKQLSYKPTAVIVGQTGAGKTSLGNKLCNTNHDAGVGKGSLTQNLSRNNVSVGMNAFWFIDTPGTDSSTDAYKHAFLLRTALTSIPINTIFFVIKFENRFERMINIFYSQPVDLYGKKMVVMISHLDQSSSPKEDFKRICDLFAKECPDVSNIIFYSEQSDAKEIADSMFSCISNMNAEKIEISDEEFQLKFNTFQATFKMRKSFEEYKRKSNKMVTDFYEYISSPEFVNQSQAEKDEILHMALVKFNNIFDDMYDTFVCEHRLNMIDLDHYTFSIKMQAENVKLCEKFSDIIIPLMSYNPLDNQDPRNLIKKCPNCGEIWYKTEGCDGTTTCGNRGFQESTGGSVISAMYNYIMTYINGKYSFVKKKNVSTLRRSAPTPTTQGVGCNATIVWRDLPKLDDELFLNLYRVKTMDEVKALIKAEHFSEARKNYESGIDTSYYH